MKAEEIGQKILTRKANRNRIIEIEAATLPNVEALPRVQQIASELAELRSRPVTLANQEQKLDLAESLAKLASAATAFHTAIQEQTKLVRENESIESELAEFALDFEHL